MGKSQFIQEVEAYAHQMAERLPKTKEGGIIIMAVDDQEVAKCLIARPGDRKKMIANLLADDEVQETITELVND